jgi:hypothetical protein
MARWHDWAGREASDADIGSGRSDRGGGGHWKAGLKYASDSPQSDVSSLQYKVNPGDGSSSVRSSTKNLAINTSLPHYPCLLIVFPEIVYP